jgi:predicted acyltransferase
VWRHWPRKLQHVAWEGFHFEDLIFPMFVFIAGRVARLLAPKMVEREGVGGAVRRIFSRTLILFALGIFPFRWVVAWCR